MKKNTKKVMIRYLLDNQKIYFGYFIKHIIVALLKRKS